MPQATIYTHHAVPVDDNETVDYFTDRFMVEEHFLGILNFMTIAKLFPRETCYVWSIVVLYLTTCG